MAAIMGTAALVAAYGTICHKVVEHLHLHLQLTDRTTSMTRYGHCLELFGHPNTQSEPAAGRSASWLPFDLIKVQKLQVEVDGVDFVPNLRDVLRRQVTPKRIKLRDKLTFMIFTTGAL